jgi:hypothetical protein
MNIQDCGPELRLLIPEDAGSTSFETSVKLHRNTRRHVIENSYPQLKCSHDSESYGRDLRFSQQWFMKISILWNVKKYSLFVLDLLYNTLQPLV